MASTSAVAARPELVAIYEASIMPMLRSMYGDALPKRRPKPRRADPGCPYKTSSRLVKRPTPMCALCGHGSWMIRDAIEFSVPDEASGELLVELLGTGAWHSHNSISDKHWVNIGACNKHIEHLEGIRRAYAESERKQEKRKAKPPRTSGASRITLVRSTLFTDITESYGCAFCGNIESGGSVLICRADRRPSKRALLRLGTHVRRLKSLKNAFAITSCSSHNEELALLSDMVLEQGFVDADMIAFADDAFEASEAESKPRATFIRTTCRYKVPGCVVCNTTRPYTQRNAAHFRVTSEEHGQHIVWLLDGSARLLRAKDWVGNKPAVLVGVCFAHTNALATIRTEAQRIGDLPLDHIIRLREDHRKTEATNGSGTTTDDVVIECILVRPMKTDCWESHAICFACGKPLAAFQLYGSCTLEVLNADVRAVAHCFDDHIMNDGSFVRFTKLTVSTCEEHADALEEITQRLAGTGGVSRDIVQECILDLTK
ncbi:MAG: hypothetical protein ABIG71_03715 [Candidatus Uhrbacteria bacterium]